jgi:RNA polymerase sigma factor (sigma-70 family)
MSRGTRGSVYRSIQTLFGVGSFAGMTDSQLLERFLTRGGEEAEAAFAALVANHGPMVWDLCRGILVDPHAAEDAFQATFLVLVRKAGSIRRRDAVGPWLHGVARRVAVRAKRAAARWPRGEARVTEMTAPPGPDPLRRNEFEALHEEVSRLAEKYRAPLVLCYFEGRTQAEAAQLLHCPVGTVGVRLYRARELLRGRMARRGCALAVGWAGATFGSETAQAAIPSGLVELTIEAAMRAAAGGRLAAGAFPAAVTQLAEGVIRTMTITKLTVAAASVLAAGLVTAGAGWLAAGAGGQRAQVGPLAAAPQQAGDQVLKARAASTKNLMQLGLAMHNYAHENQKRFPAAAIQKDGKPLLSWRVALLPYLAQQALYAKFHLDEPWDSPHNKTLLDEMPATYASPVPKDDPKSSTYYQVFAGPGTLFGGEEGTKIDDIADGSAMTIMIVEAANPVPWTKPEDVPFNAAQPLPQLGGLFEDGFNVLFADGSARFIRKNVPPNVLRALITYNGREMVTLDQF